jgi:hypothetical protein
VLFLLGTGWAQAQQSQVMSGVTSTADGVLLQYRTVVEPAERAGTRYQLGGGVMVGRSVRRYVYNADSYFGYDLMAAPINGGQDVRIGIGPLTLAPPEIAAPGKPDRQLIRLPKYSQPMIVKSGSTVEIEILRSPMTGQRVVDFLTVSVKPTQAARNWELRLVEPAGTAGSLTFSSLATLSGNAVFLQVPRKGVLVLSVIEMPGRGFQRVGEVDGNAMRVQWEGEAFQIVSRKSIVPGGGRWHVYGRLMPKNVGNEFVIGTSDL